VLIDIHVHSNHTPGCLITVAELVAAAKKNHLDGFCLTDLHTTAGAAEAKRLAAEAGLVALVGFEAVTDRGHYLAFVPEPEALGDINGWLGHTGDGPLPFDLLAKAVAEKAGLLIAAHPYDREVEGAPGDGLLQLPGVVALEVYNARRPAQANDLAEEVAAGTGLPGVAGSDARQDVAAIGRVASLVQGKIETEAELIERIKAFDIWPIQIGEIKARRRDPADRPRRRGGRDDRPRRRDGAGRGDRKADGRSSRRSDGKPVSSNRGRSRKRGPRPPKKTD